MGQYSLMGSYDYQAIRDRVLTKLKLGKQSASGKASDAFIRELQKQDAGNISGDV